MIRNFFRHIGESFKSLKRNGWMTLASVSAVTVTLVLVGIFLSVILNVSKLAQDIEKAVDVSVFVELGTEDKGLDKLEKELQTLPGVTNVKFSSSEEQYEKLVETMGDSFEIFKGDENPLYDVFIVSAKTPEAVKQVQKKAETLTNVYKADYGGLSSDKIFSLSKNVRFWGLIGMALLLFVAIFLISNTIRITIISRKREIQIMRLVGAKNAYIRWPFFLEGAWIGILGSIVPILTVLFGYRKSYQVIMKTFMATGNYSLIHPDELTMWLASLVLIIGVVIGSIGSIFSMRRFLKI
ncbi:permease-like cell division protein FtsX [Vagococcus xieshaowenii]|uniref:Cell division protein FtsX n=1 Tax=Vagococcus xieshaowenii TaxID=2562451 RepID=A0AAJ5JMC1_9ENTE|nr:permease-like cell division protein FtsX [Vagococcus xieshaowenii]QCA28818.1 ABC transporter permease [Vagococcus xieshaowenii]TFZ42981.1 ABC transporter permease [Vagococcus xieshaowenii]